MQGSGATPASTISDSSQNKEHGLPLLFHSFALTLDKLGCNRKYKEKYDFPLLFHSFALTLDKLGGVSEEQNKKFSCFCFVLRSTCTNFAPKIND